METVIRLGVIPDANAKLTPLELLEDFADASPDWQYLEEDSQHYAVLKDRPACILRHRHADVRRYVDFGFAATNPADRNDIELVILDTPDTEGQLDLAARNEAIDRFIQHFRQYLGGRPGHASLRVEKEDIDPSRTSTKPRP